MKNKFRIVYVSALLLIPLVLLLLPSDFFDTGQSTCASVLLFNKTCYGCGMTRGVQHLLHLEFVSAATFNKLSFVVLPILLVLWYAEIKRMIKKIKLSKQKS